MPSTAATMPHCQYSLSDCQRLPTLCQEELQVVLEHQADVVDAILQHGDTLDADAEGETGILVRVDIAVLQHLAVDNAAAQHLDPAGVLAQISNLHSSTGTSVAPRWFHCSVSMPRFLVVTKTLMSS